MNIFNEFDSILSKKIKPFKTTNINNKDELMQLLTTDYSDAYNKALDGVVIYRGHKTPNEFAVLKTTGLRASQNTSNIYTTLFSEVLPSWANFPKRNACFICTNSEDKASEYSSGGNISIVLPQNGEKIGVCSNSDIWDSFGSTFGSYDIRNLSYFNKIFSSYLMYIRLVRNKIENINEGGSVIENVLMNLFSKKIKSVKAYLRNYSQYIYKNLEQYEESFNQENLKGFSWLQYQPDFLEVSLDFIKKSPKDGLINFLDVLLNPVTNNFVLLNSINEMKRDDYSKEIWFGGTALFINRDHDDIFIKDYNYV